MVVHHEPLYKCDVCGTSGPWRHPPWVCLMVAMGSGYRGWEHNFHCCSDACAEKIRAMPKKEREKLAYQILGFTKPNQKNDKP